MADLGVSEADLRVGNGDSVISGEGEFAELHARLVELDQTRPITLGGVQLDRAAQLYAVLSGHADPGARVVEQAAPRSGTSATAREALALRSFQNLRDAGFLNEAEGYGGALPAAAAERFAADFPAESAALRGRAPTYQDLFVALSRDHDGNGTIDLKVGDLFARGMFGEPPTVNEQEATAVLLGRDGRGALRDERVGPDVSGTRLADQQGRATEVGRTIDRFGRRSTLRVADRPDASADALAITRTKVLLRQGEVGRDTLVRELSAHPTEIRNLGLALLGADANTRAGALEVAARLSVSSAPEARAQGARLLDQLEHVYTPAAVGNATVDAVETGTGERQATMRDLRLAGDRVVDRVYGNARTGRGGIRSTTNGAAEIPAVRAELRRVANGVRASLDQNAQAIQRLEVLRSRVEDGTPEAAALDRGLTQLHQERITLLESGARIAARLERAAAGLADDTGWVRASYHAGDRRGALDDAGALARDLRTMARDEIAALRMGAAGTDLDAAHVGAIELELERTMVEQQAHVRTFSARLRAARGNDQYRLDVLGATKDTLALIRSDFPSDLEVARRAHAGDVDAQDQLRADREQELTALGVNPADPRWEGKTTLEVIVTLAKNGDLTAAARLTQAQSAMTATIDQATTLLQQHQATPAQLEAMRTLRDYVGHYNFTRPEDLSSFDLAALETRFNEQLAAAGLHGIVPRPEIDKMQQIHDEAQQFTLLTDLAAGVLDPSTESSRDENAARVMARDAAMRDPAHAYAVVRQQTSTGILFRVRQLSAAEEQSFRGFATDRGAAADRGTAAPFGSVYVARRTDTGIQETDRYGSYSTDPNVAALFRPTSEGGPPVSQAPTAAQEAEMYRSIYDRASARVADRYRAALRTFDSNGVGARPDRATFDRSITNLVAGLKAQSFTPPTVREHNRDVPKGEIELRQVLQLYGADAEGAADMANALWNGRTTATDVFSGMDPNGMPYYSTHDYNVKDRLFASAQGTYRRFNERLTEITRPYAGTAADVGEGREQVFDLFREFPDLADEFYRQQGFTSLTGFPPQSRPGTSPGSAAERSFLAAATEWQDHEETMGYLKMGGVIAVGIVVTVGTGGLAGPEAAAIAGVIFAAGASMPEVVSSVEALGRAQDARRVGAASDQTVRFRENEVTGAVAGLYVNVLTAGLTAGTAGNVTRAGARALLREAVRDTLIGAGSGALTTALNPNVWDSDNTAGLILKGAIVGGVGGAVGWGAGRGVQAVGRRIAIAFPRPVDAGVLRVGSQVDVAIEGQRAPERWRVARMNQDSGMMTLEREGRQIEVSIREVQRVSVDPDSPLAAAMRAGRVDESGAPVEDGGVNSRAPGDGGITNPPPEPPRSPPPEARPAAPPRAPRPAEAARVTDGPSEAFSARVGNDHPLLSEAVARISGPNARDVQLRAMGAAERNPTVRAFIEANGTKGARLVGELGEVGFMRAIGDRSTLPFGFDRVLEARPEETIRLARSRPDDFRALLDGMDRSTAIGDFARDFGVAKGGQLARIQSASPDGVELLLGQPNGRQTLADALGRSRDEAVAMATAAQDRTYRAPDGRLVERGPPPQPAPTPSRASLEALCQRAGVDPAVLDNPTAHPAEMARVIEQMRSELSPADRAALDLEMNGRRFIDAQHYGPAKDAGVVHPENLYGAAAYQAWARAEGQIMGAARRGQPLTLDMLTGAHRAASETVVADGARGRLRSDPTRPADQVHQGGEGPMSVQWVTPETRAALESNPDLNVSRLDPIFGARPDGTVPVAVAYTSPQHVQARMNELVTWVNAELARPGADPVAIAAEAQRRFVSIHPFADANGRMSRLLMDYCLARGGLPPSVVADPNVDTHLTLPEWTQQVRDGLAVPFEATQNAWARAQARGAAAAPRFAPEPQARAQGFADQFVAGGNGRTAAQGAELYGLAGGNRTDPVSGLGNAVDIAPTIDRAAAHVASTGEPAVVVRGSIRNLGGLNARLAHAQADGVIGDMGRIMQQELARIPGARVDGFRNGPDYTFVVTGRDLPQAQVDQAMARARTRINDLMRTRGLNNVDHPKHPGEPAWQGVGMSTATTRVTGSDTAASVSNALGASIERYNLGLGQIPAPPASRAPASSAAPTLTFHDVPPPTDGPASRPPQRGNGVPRFQSEEQVRRAAFEARARELGVTDAAEIQRLYQQASGRSTDPVTGFGLPADRAPTLERAVAYAQAHGEQAHYVEIDIRNLGGLTQGVGRSAADADFGVASQMIREELGAIGADVHLFRHGGDELSAVVTGPGVSKPQIEAALARAQQRFDAYAQARGIDQIPHPKHPDDPSRRGVGFTYGVAEAPAGAPISEVFDRAGLIVEQRKAAGGLDPNDARLERLGLSGAPIGELATRLDRELDANQRRIDEAVASSARRRTTGIR